MIGILLGGLLRILLWFFAFYLVATAIRAIAQALFPSARDARPKREERGVPKGSPANRPEAYRDVKDARYSDVPADKQQAPRD